ncbi:MAG: alkaline phosphatase D family protein, partial [Planctomycetaceae bacterium]
PGASGQVRVRYGTREDLAQPHATAWVEVSATRDFTHQFHLANIQPNTRYHLSVEARDGASRAVSARQQGSFRTAARKSAWQDVRFTVVTGQSYWDLDHADGYHIYPSMQELSPDFLVATGDTVYLDSEAPRARTVELARYHWQRMYSLPRLVAFHRHIPGYWQKDDHDAWCNDCWPTMKAAWMHPLTFTQGLQIFREQVPMGRKTYRTIRWGSGLQIWLVEGRDFRSPNTMADGPQKTIWGQQQREWLMQSILASDADFRVLISPTPIVGPDRSKKADNHSNRAFQHAGDLFRNWTRTHQLDNFFVCCGDRHWQYMSVDPQTGLREFCCGPASDKHAGGTPGQDDAVQPFHRVQGGFLSVAVTRTNERPTIVFRHHGVRGAAVHAYRAVSQR